jgi:enterochelin esterase-like enzyme
MAGAAVAALILVTLLQGAMAGSVRSWTFHSQVLGREVRTELFLPSDPTKAERPWAVLYLLHGLAGNERDWVDAGRIDEIMEPLIASGRIPPMLVVMPDGNDSWYIDDPRPSGFGPVFQAFSQELVEAVDAAFPTAACRELRLAGGLSMGGYGALLMGMDHPDRFGAVLGLSSAIFPPMPDDPAERARRHVFMFGALFSDPFDWQRFNRWNLFPRIPALAATQERPAIWLDAGDDDFPSLLATNVDFFLQLRAAGVEAELRVVDGAHNWEHWRPALSDALTWAGRSLPTACTS